VSDSEVFPDEARAEREPQPNSPYKPPTEPQWADASRDAGQPVDPPSAPLYPAEPAYAPTDASGDADLGADGLPAEEREVREESFLRWLGELVVLVALAFVLAMGIKTFVVQPFVIPSGSMEPTLQIQDRVLVNKFVYRFQKPQQGDVVVFLSPESNSIDYIKRVVAVGGQTVDIQNGVVRVDGKPLRETYVNHEVQDTYTSQQPIKVPADSVFLMGDNRTNSRDSRYFGPRPVSSLLGKAFFIYWPFNRLHTL
jgi:signal peptidase I